MGQLAKRMLLFLALSLLVYAGSMAFLAHVRVLDKPLVYSTGEYYNWPGGDTWARFHEFDPKKSYDAIIIGSSHAYRGYDPSVFAAHGHQVFNLGSSGQTPLNTYWLIREYLNSSNAPLLIFDVYEGVFTSTGLESTADLTQNQPNDAAALGMAWDLRDLRGLNMVGLRLLARHAKPFYTDKEYLGLGYAPYLDSMRTTAGPPGAAPTRLDPRQQHFFEACLRLCQERGIRVVVSSHFARRNARDTYHAPLAKYIGQALHGTGIPYLDFTNAVGIEDLDWFSDKNHLNAAGAKIFTEQLVDSLEVRDYWKDQ